MSDEVKAKNIGTVTDSMQVDGVFDANCTIMEEHNSGAVNSRPDIQLSLNDMPNLNTWTEKEFKCAIMDEVQVTSRPEEFLKHVPLNNQLFMDKAGLPNTKPKTTWTWFNRIGVWSWWISPCNYTPNTWEERHEGCCW